MNREQIERLAQHVLDALEDSGLVQLKDLQDLDAMKGIIFDTLEKELR